MFVLCPHCQFLVTLDPASGQPPLCCPRCEGLLQTQSDPASASAAAMPQTAVVDETYAQSAAAEAIADTETSLAASEHVPPPADAATAATTSVPANTIAEAMLGPEAVEVEIAAGQDAPEPALPGPPVEPRPKSRPRAKPKRRAKSRPEPEPAAAIKPVRPAAKAAPSFARVPAAGAAPNQRRRWFKVAAIAALSLLLLLQVLLADRAQLAADARWRPLLSTLCGALRCTFPPWHEPAAFILLNRDVRPHPTIPGALRVTATFRNDARWPQPWPSLLLTLSDLDGRAAGARMFAPRDYLDAAPTRNELASGQSASIAMDVLEPAPRIVAFTFDFR